MKKIVSRLLTLIAACALLAGLTACAGASEADKAYEAWANNSLPKIEKATADYKDRLAQKDVTAMTEYLAVIEGITNELAAIDTSKLGDANRKAVDEQLPALRAQVDQLKNAIAAVAAASDQPGGEQAGTEQAGAEQAGTEQATDEQAGSESENEDENQE